MHAVRTHLANVRLALELLHRKARSDPHQARVARAGLSSAQYLSRLLLVQPKGGQGERPRPV